MLNRENATFSAGCENISIFGAEKACCRIGFGTASRFRPGWQELIREKLLARRGAIASRYNLLAGCGLLQRVDNPWSGSSFPDPGAAGIDCNCASTQLDVALNGVASAKVDALNISPTALSGVLSRIPGSPFTGPGANSNVAVLSPDDSKLFVSNQGSNTVTVFSVAANGSLTVVPGSPFPAPGAISPAGMATNQAGTGTATTMYNRFPDVEHALFRVLFAAIDVL